MAKFLGKNIRYLRRANLMSQDQLAERLNRKSFTTVQSWETGRTNPPALIVQSLADMFGVSMDDLVNNDLTKEPLSAFRGARSETDPIRIPVLGRIPAGVPIEAIEAIIDYEELSPRYYQMEKDYFALMVRGDSMEPLYLDGDIVVVEACDVCDSGSDCIVMVNDHDATLKRIYKYQNGAIELRPLNDNYDKVFYSPEEVADLPVHVCGIVREIRRRV